MSVILDVETCPIPMNQIPAENKEYLVEKSKNKRSGKIIDGESYGNGAIGKFELNRILCCCMKKDDQETIAHTGDEKDIISDVFGDIRGESTIVGFNSNSFDLPMLKMRGIINGLHTCVIPFNIKNWSEHFVDVRYQLTDQYGVGDLSYFARVFGIDPPKWDEGMDKSDLSQYPIEQVVKACKDDVRATSELYNRLNNKLKGE